MIGESSPSVGSRRVGPIGGVLGPGVSVADAGVGMGAVEVAVIPDCVKVGGAWGGGGTFAVGSTIGGGGGGGARGGFAGL